MVCCLTLCVMPGCCHSHRHTEPSTQKRSILPRPHVLARRQSAAQRSLDWGLIPGLFRGTTNELSLSRLSAESTTVPLAKSPLTPATVHDFRAITAASKQSTAGTVHAADMRNITHRLE